MSTFDEILTQILALLQREGRLAYRALKLRFGIDDEYVAALKEELIDAKRIAVDEDGKVLVWVGNIEEDKGKRITDKGRNGESEGDRAKRRQGEKEKDAGPSSAERRQLTVMFIDLVGSTTLSQQLDPED